MTIEEINAMVVEGNEITLMLRMIDIENLPEGEDFYSYPEGEEPSWDNLILNSALGTKPTNQDLEDELVIYKAELVAQEEVRLAEIARIANLKSRWSKLFDKRLANPDVANPDVYFRDSILKESDKNLAESRLAAVETKDAAEKIKYNAQQAKIPMEELRVERDAVLSSTDFTQLADAPITSAEKTEYRNYRQFLRELPQKISNQQWLEYRVPTFQEFKEL